MAKDTPKSHVRLKAGTGIFVVSGLPATFRLHTPLPAEHPLYQKIGRVACEWAHLEHVLDLIIWEMSGTAAGPAACITSQIMGAAGRLRAIQSLAELSQLDTTVIDQIKKLHGKASGLVLHRNRIVHDAWYLDRTAQKPGQFRSVPFASDVPPKYGIRDVDEKYIDKKLSEIAELSKLAGTLRINILSQISPSALRDT